MLDILIQAGSYVAIIFLGMFLRRVGFFGPEAFPVLSNVVIKITLPAAIIYNAAGRTIDTQMLLIPLLGLAGGILYIAVAALVHIRGTKEQRSFAVLNTAGYNIGVFAMPFTQGFLGSMGVAATTLFDVGNSFICLGGSFGAASAIKAGEAFNLRRILKTLATSIPFVTYVITVTMNLLYIPIPGPVVSCAKLISGANAAMAMLMVGVGFQLSGDRSQAATIARILVPRYAIAAVLALCYYHFLPFSLEVRQTLVILCFSPIGAAVPGFTQELGEDTGLSSAINSIAILISIVIIVTLLVIML